MKVGIIDSGLGGIGVFKAILMANPRAQAICLADQKNAPYGNKDKDALKVITRNNIQWLASLGVNQILLACNTTTSLVLDELKPEFPNLKLIGIIDMTCEQLMGTDYNNLLVLATSATVSSKKYLENINKYLPNCNVYQHPLKELAGMIENNENRRIISKYLEQELEPYIDKVEGVVLGCTHYPIVKKEIEQILGVDIFDSNIAASNYDFNFTSLQDFIEVYTTGDPSNTEKQVKKLYGLKIKIKSAQT